MKTIDYLIVANGVIERGMFYNYMHELGYKDHFLCSREQMIHSVYPFAVSIKKKTLMIIESATICYFSDKNGIVKTIDEFKDILKKK